MDFRHLSTQSLTLTSKTPQSCTYKTYSNTCYNGGYSHSLNMQVMWQVLVHNFYRPWKFTTDDESFTIISTMVSPYLVGLHITFHCLIPHITCTYINTLDGGYIRLSYIVLDSQSVFRAFCAADFLASFTVLCGFPRKLPQLTITRCWCGRSLLPLATHSYLGSRCLCCSQYSFSFEIASLPQLVVGNGTEAQLFFN